MGQYCSVFAKIIAVHVTEKIIPAIDTITS